MARLALSLLGPLRITLDARPISGIAYHKARALLAYLAVECDRPHQRAALVGLLWPELSDTAARTNLRQVLTNLREAIGDATARTPFLLITRDTIQLNPASDVELDVTTLTTLLNACATHPHRHRERCRSCIARMEQAISHYRGDFLADFALSDSVPFEEWQLVRRERLHQRALGTLTRLADYYERCNRDEQAQHYAQRQIELDPWREEAHQQLMRLFARGGQRSAALAQYATCRRILARDLGVAPAEETTTLYERIRDAAPNSANHTPSAARTHPHALPIPSTPLIGRERECAELADWLENPDCRLITIIGPGGIGKTRLALAAAADQITTFTLGVVFVPLAGLSSAAFLATTMLAALNVLLYAQRDPRDQLLEYLSEHELLLVLDNFEQLLVPDIREQADASALLADILQQAPGVTMLVTSRERLALHGEWLFDMSGLSYPLDESAGNIATYAAVQLFLQRANQIHRQFMLQDGDAHAVARICRLTEGMPLAIELAAASVRQRACAVIASEIEANARILSSSLRDVPERHRTIWATFDHSWRLLAQAERLALRGLAVFRGGFDEAAAAQIAQASPRLVAILIDKSLVRRSEPGRYTTHELIRQYALEQLREAGDVEETHERHLRFFLTVATAAEAQFDTPEAQRWLTRLDVELDNLRVALDWSLQAWERAHGTARNALTRRAPALYVPETFTPAELGAQLAAALGQFWFQRRYFKEGCGWLQAAIRTCRMSIQVYAEVGDKSAIDRIHATLGKLLLGLGALESIHGEYGRALEPLEESLTVFRTLDDQRSMALALLELGAVLGEHERYHDAALLLEEALALFRAQGDQWRSAKVLYHLGMNATDRGDSQRGTALTSESLAFFRALDDRKAIISSLNALGKAVMVQGDYTQARALFEEAVALDQAIDPQRSGSAWTLGNLAVAAQGQGDEAYAAACYRESMMLRAKNNNRAGVAWALEGLAELSWRARAPLRAARLWGAAESLRAAAGAGMAPDEHVRHDRAVSAARTHADTDAFMAAWAAGRAMTLEQAIAAALDQAE
jgi:predicted ATPase/DNA-binding SARP family transcriptional activator